MYVCMYVCIYALNRGRNKPMQCSPIGETTRAIDVYVYVKTCLIAVRETGHTMIHCTALNIPVYHIIVHHSMI